MTPEATQLVQPLTFQAITHRPVSVDMFHLLAETEIGHVTIAREADLVIIAPATAHSLAKFALGLADDMVANEALGSAQPIASLAPQAARMNKQTFRALKAPVALQNHALSAIENIVNGPADPYAYAASAEHREGISAFLDKRAPVF